MSRRSSSITVRTYNHYEADVGLIQDSRKLRQTEVDAELRIRYGDPIPASDAIRELRDQGYKRCCRCGQYKPPDAFSRYKHQNRPTEYLHAYCKSCRNEMEKTKRFSRVESANPYPKRLD